MNILAAGLLLRSTAEYLTKLLCLLTSVAPLQCLTKLLAVLQAVLCYNLLLDFGSVLVSIYLHSSKEGSLSRSDHRSDSVSSVSFERSWKTTTAYVITLCINNLSQITHISPT